AQLGEHYLDRVRVGGSIPSAFTIIAGWSSPVARRAHNPKAAGSNPAPATNLTAEPWCRGLTCLPVTQEIAGSNPVGSAMNYFFAGMRTRLVRRSISFGSDTSQSRSQRLTK